MSFAETPYFFDPAAERERFERRRELLRVQDAMRLELAPGITFQPETPDSVEDQIRETLLAEGKEPEMVDREELAEVRTSFAVLAQRREGHGTSVAATLMLGFPERDRAPRLEALAGFPEQLRLQLSNGQQLIPEVDRGAAGPDERLPAVLALRYLIPDGVQPMALVSTHPVLSGQWIGEGWSRWIGGR